MKGKGQAAVEFFVYSSVFLAILLGAYFAVSFMQAAEVSEKESRYVKWSGEYFASTINTAMVGVPGFSYTIRFEKTLLGSPYSVQFRPAVNGENGSVFITRLDNNMSYRYPINSMNITNGSCVRRMTTSLGNIYYEINTSQAALNFYNDGESIMISQGGC